MRVKELRKKAGFTQKDMARFLNIDQSTYANKENGRRKFEVDEACILEEIFKVPVIEIFGRGKSRCRH